MPHGHASNVPRNFFGIRPKATVARVPFPDLTATRHFTMSKLSQAVDRYCLHRVNRRYGLRLSEDHEPDDVFVVGYPKSGNTWMQNLLSCVRFGCDGRRTPDSVIQHLVPDVHAQPFHVRLATPMFFKSHHLPRPDYRRVIYLLRDGRDVMVAYRYYLECLQAVTVRCYADLQRLSVFGPWHKHVAAWLQNPFGAQLLVVKYEDLVAQPTEQLRRICEFTGIAATDETIQAAVTSCAFEKLREKEAVSGLFRDWPVGKPFFRRGIVGSHRDELDETFLHDFLADAQPVLQQQHYL